MKKIPYKVRMGIGVGLVLWSLAAFIVTIVIAAYGAPIWTLILIPIVAVITFVIGIIFVPKTNEDGTPFVVKKKSNSKKLKKRKTKKVKRPFMTDDEWREQEEEDDEMIFIEEVVEDD